MRTFLQVSLAVMLLAGCAMAQPATNAPPNASPKPAEPAADPAVDEVLDMLDARGKQLTDMVASVKLSETDNALGLSTARTGKMWLQRKTPTEARIRVTFEKKIAGDKTREEKIDYVLDGGWLIEQDYQKRINIRRQVLRPGEKMDLFKLGEGPFPLPLGQDKQDVHKLFDVKKFAAAKTDPPNTAHVELKPKAGTKLASKFSSISIWVDTTSRMPVKIETLDPNESTLQTTELTDIDTSTKLGDKHFEVPKVDPANWQIRDEPFSD